MAKRTTTSARHQKVQAEFNKLKKKGEFNPNGKVKQVPADTGAIIQQLAAKYDYSPATVEQILFRK